MSETIGQRLQSARNARRLTIEQVVQATRIRALYIDALERDDFTVMPSPVQGRGFLRLYAQYLELDVDAILAEMRQSAYQDTAQMELSQAKPAASADQPPEVESLPGETTSFWTRQLERLKSIRISSPTGAIPTEGESPTESESLSDGEIDRPVENTAPEEASRTEPEQEMDEQTESAPDESVPSRPAFRKSLFVWPEHFRPSRRQAETGDDETQTQAIPEQSAHEIFNDIGVQLRTRRELLSLTLDEVEQHTRVRARYLQALEQGQVDDLPSSVQTRGMLHNYAAFLDVDAEGLLLRFAEGLQARHRERQSNQPHNSGQHGRFTPLKSFIASDLIFGIGMVALLIVFVTWVSIRILNAQPDVEAESEAPSISDVLLASPVGVEGTFEPTPTLVLEGVAAAQETAVPAEETQGAVSLSSGLVQVTISVVERTWMRVLVDGKVEFEGRVIPGAAYPYTAQEQVEVLTGNGAALRIVHNQKDLGRMGNFGEVVDRIYVIDDILVPTATVTPTVTPTLPPTITPVPSRTPVSAPAIGE